MFLIKFIIEERGGKYLCVTKEKEWSHTKSACILTSQNAVMWDFFSILEKAQTEYSKKSTPGFGFDFFFFF